MLERVPLLGYLDRKLKAEPYGFVFSLGLLYLGAAVGIGITEADLIPAFTPDIFLIIYGATGSILTTGTVLIHLWRTR